MGHSLSPSFQCRQELVALWNDMAEADTYANVLVLTPLTSPKPHLHHISKAQKAKEGP